MNKKNTELGLYIHIPYCKSKCFYCDFNSFASKKETIPEYFKALNKELKAYGEITRGSHIRSIFIGGGTPSSVEADYIKEVMNTIRKTFNVLSNAEITIETNPGTLSYKNLKIYRDIGINRLSMGLQACQNDLLTELGRIHTFEEFWENFKQAREAGFDNINIDLMFALPGQTLEMWENTLDKIIDLDSEHISAYSLKIEEGTVFGDRYEKNELKSIDDETDRAMYYMALKKLSEAKYKHYEISNFAKEGNECKHNIVYWKAEEYIGVGAGSHSYFKDERYGNIEDIDKYIEAMKINEISKEEATNINKIESMSEYMILGLRLIDGVDINKFEVRYGCNLCEIYKVQIERFLREGLLVNEDGKIKLTLKGLDLANTVMCEFL